MNTIRNYLITIFGDQVSIEIPATEQPNNLPFYLASLYTLCKGELLEHQVYFAMYKQDELLTPDQYKKHMDNLRELMGNPVILVLKGTESYNRNRLIQKKVNFILENKQVFLPSLLVDLKDYLKPERPRKEHLTPAAQYLLLFHLQKQNLNSTTYRQLSDILPYNYLTISRAIENLANIYLCNIEGGKEKLLRFVEDKKEIWVKALPYLTNPVKKTVYINNELPEQFRTLTFINALAHYTNISDAPRDHFAIYARDFQMLGKSGQIPMFSEYDGNYYVELWKYPPIIIDDERYVDRLSLYLACRNTKNERIEGELETMIEKMPW
jgi:hypothetical protein